VLLMCTAPLILLALAWDIPVRYLDHLASGCALFACGVGARHLFPPMPETEPALRFALWGGGLVILALAIVHAVWIVAPL
jgi:hypothetical protein